MSDSSGVVEIMISVPLDWYDGNVIEAKEEIEECITQNLPGNTSWVFMDEVEK